MNTLTRYVTECPEWVPVLEQKWFTVRNQGSALSALVHVQLAAMFWYLGMWPLVVINALVAPLYLGLIALQWRGWRRLVGTIAHTEANLHVLACALLLGTESGFSLYFFTLALLPMLMFTPAERALQGMFTVVPIFAYIVAELATITPPAWAVLTPDTLESIYLINLVGSFVTLIAPVAYFYWGSLSSERELHEQRNRNWDLLLNMMPERIAAQLLEDPGVIADQHGQVSVLFADIAGFTTLSTHTEPESLVALLNDVFSRFDAIVATQRVEKIKTIGDAYMAAAGLPGSNEDHAMAVARTALQMRDALADICVERKLDLHLRIGIHTGPVMAGVIGVQRFRYDLWGDTVNTASRMESQGRPGRIQISEATAAALGEQFAVDIRGVIDVKGKGSMCTYWLLSEKSPALTT